MAPWLGRCVRFFWLPRRFHGLAEYNAETWRGVVHTEAATKRFDILQLEYVRWSTGERDWRQA